MPLKMKLITERIEEVNYITESTEDGKKALYIQGPFLVAEQGNKNRRMYKLDTLARDRKSTRLNSSHTDISRMPSSA